MVIVFEGKIDARQAKKILKDSLGLEVNEKTDFEGNAKIGKAFFSAIAAEKTMQKKNALRIFQLFDKDHKGLVVVEDVRREAAELGETLSTEEIDEMMSEIDKSGEGLLTSEDFVELARKIGL